MTTRNEYRQHVATEYLRRKHRGSIGRFEEVLWQIAQPGFKRHCGKL